MIKCLCLYYLAIISPPDSHGEVSDAPKVCCPRQGAEHVIVDGVAVDHRVLGQVPRGHRVILIVVVVSWVLNVVHILVD